MNKRNLMLGAVVVAIIAIAGIAYFLRPVKEASEDVQENTEQLSSENDAQSVFRISQDESEVSFSIDEVLRGSPFTAVGKTSEVAGDIVIDFANPSASQIGQIRISGRTLKTDNSFRDGAISREILETSKDEYEFIEFETISIDGLPDVVAIGDTVEFEITGNLIIKGIANAVTFDTIVTLVSEEQITGTADAQVLRSDYDISIPSVPQVANVADEVFLNITFTANLVTEDMTETTEEAG